MESSSLSPSSPARPIRVRLPFITTSFVEDVWYYALLWPLWWLLGIEQILLPFFLVYELARFLVRSNWRVRINTTGLIALALAIWWLVPIFWVDRRFLDLFLKEMAAVWSQVILLVLIFTCARTRHDWWVIAKALTVMAVYTAASGAIYVSGVWQGSVTSALGMALPSSLVESSAFFSSIGIRAFGSSAGEVGIIPIRLRSLSLSYSSLSMICLLLIPFMYWRMKIATGRYRILFAAVTVGLFFCLIFTESRISYMAFAAAVPLYWMLRAGVLRGHNLPFTIALTLVAVGGGLLLGYIAQGLIFETLQSAFVDLRPSSWLVRFNIYLVTLHLLPEHLIAGWGAPVRIPGVSNEYSAGTHSSYLGILFQHGIIGLALYLALWISIWRQVIQGLKDRLSTRELALFWISAATAFLAFNIREIADSWWWDQSLTFVMWLFWGLVITAARCLAADRVEEAA